MGMVESFRRFVTRRAVLRTACAGSAAFVSAASLLPRDARASDEDIELVGQLTGRTPTESDRLRLLMPPVFANGYTVPLALEVDSAMSDTDHVRHVRIFAPRNPIIEVARFRFTPQSGKARISTRIRLAEAQNVLAAAEMSDGAFLMTKTWVEVATNGCA
jgi:sulfur-oxidizing protein SoxY